MIHAVHAMPSVSSTCDQASARRGRTERSSMAPRPLPSASPVRKTAKMIEKM